VTVRGLLYMDLLGVPYRRGGDDPRTGLDCAGVSREILRRLGAGATIPLDEAAAVAEAQSRSTWTRIGTDIAAAQAVGDQVLLDSPDAPAGLAVVVSENPLTLLTATPGRGVHALRPRAFKDVVRGVYRWGGAA